MKAYVCTLRAILVLHCMRSGFFSGIDKFSWPIIYHNFYQFQLKKNEFIKTWCSNFSIHPLHNEIANPCHSND